MKNVTRPPVKQNEIIEWIRDRIRSGDLQPTERLPTRQLIEARFGVSSLTVQRAFRHLLQDGYVETIGRSGTFVARHPPHRHRVGLVVPAGDYDLEGVNLLAVMLRQAAALEGWNGWQFNLYTRVAEERTKGDYHRLVGDLVAHRLAGLIFALSPFALVDTPIMTLPNVPRIAFTQRLPGVANVFFDYSDFIRRSAGRLVALGSRRLALIGPFIHGGYAERAFRVALAEHGQTWRPACMQVVAPSHAKWAAHIAALYMELPVEQRPDGLIIADDNLVGPVCDGIRSVLGEAPPPLIVAHCNFPERPRVSLPVIWLGFDLADLLRRSLDSLRAAVDGEILPLTTGLRARFADEPAADDASWRPGAVPDV